MMSDFDQLAARLDYIEQHLAAIWPHASSSHAAYVPFAAATHALPGPSGEGTAPTTSESIYPEPSEQVVSLARAGRKSDAILEYRKLTGAGIVAAKQVVEAIV